MKKTENQFFGKESEMKNNAPLGSLFNSIDTGEVYVYSLSGWIKVNSNNESVTSYSTKLTINEGEPITSPLNHNLLKVLNKTSLIKINVDLIDVGREINILNNNGFPFLFKAESSEVCTFDPNTGLYSTLNISTSYINNPLFIVINDGGVAKLLFISGEAESPS